LSDSKSFGTARKKEHFYQPDIVETRDTTKERYYNRKYAMVFSNQ
jgi:hypothetical protein